MSADAKRWMKAALVAADSQTGTFFSPAQEGQLTDMKTMVFPGGLVCVVLAIVAAVLQTASKHGQPELLWIGICALYGAFCRQAAVGVATPWPGSLPSCSPPSPL